MKWILAIVCLLSILGWAVTRIIFGIQFDIACGDYISQAASSPNPEVAAQRLDVAISYAETNGLVAGNTSIFFAYPTNDLAFWHKRLVDSRTILRQLPQRDSPLEISNTMMRVHETLVSNSKEGVTVRTPDGISVYPHNVAFFWWAIIFSVLMIGFFVAALIELGI